MKKFLSVLLAVVLMMTMSVPAFAAISPTASVITTTTGATTPDGGNDSPTSPATGDQLWIVMASAVLVASLATVCVASKKLAKNG